MIWVSDQKIMIATLARTTAMIRLIKKAQKNRLTADNIKHSLSFLCIMSLPHRHYSAWKSRG